MDADDFLPGGSPPDRRGEQSRRGADRLSRRQALHRLGLGVAGGAAAWAAPEILIGRPTAAGATSAAPQGGGVSGAGTGATPGGTGSATGAATPTTVQAGAATGSGDSPADAPPGAGGGPQLAFTGFDAERAVELGTGLLVGGWMLTRWSGRREGDGAADPSAEQPPQPS
jgi:hypothetical protein